MWCQPVPEAGRGLARLHAGCTDQGRKGTPRDREAGCRSPGLWTQGELGSQWSHGAVGDGGLFPGHWAGRPGSPLSVAGTGLSPEEVPTHRAFPLSACLSFRAGKLGKTPRVCDAFLSALS